MQPHPESIPSVHEQAVRDLSPGDTLIIRNETGETEHTLVLATHGFGFSSRRVTVIREDLTIHNTDLHSYELVRTTT